MQPEELQPSTPASACHLRPEIRDLSRERLACERLLETRGKRRGRPQFFGIADLMLVWLFVEEGVLRTGQSVHKFCKHHEFRRYANARDESTPWVIRGETLRRCYYDACKTLRTAAAEHLTAEPAAGTATPYRAARPFLQHWWNSELERRLANRCW